MAKQLKTLFTLATPLLIAAAGGLWLFGLLDWPARSEGALTYDTAEVTRGTIRKVVNSSGPVRALVTVSIGSQLSGQIEQVKVDFNSEVKTGDVLALVDNRTFKARVAQAKADVASADAQLINQEAALKKAEAVRTEASRSIQRQKTLQGKGFASTAAVDLAQRAIEVAEADIAVARAQIESAKANVAQKSAALEQAQVDLDRTVISSPIDGTVISRTVDVGQTVAASLQAPELFKIAQDLRRIRIEAQVNEADVGAVEDGNAVTFGVDAYPDKRFEGKVTQVRLAATELQNIVTYTVIIEASNEDRRLFPGMTANVEIEAAKKDGVLRVPNDVLRFKPRVSPEAQADRDQGGRRGERAIERLKEQVELTVDQEQKLRDALTQLFDGLKSGQPGAMQAEAVDPSAMRQRVQSAIEQALGPTLTETQRPMFEKWKRGREGARAGAVHVISATGMPERRFVRLGISDDQFTEIVGGKLAEGEKVILRARQAQK